MNVLIQILQLILALSILILIHELGHFLFARLFKIRVEKFYLFFNPWFSIFKYKPKNSDTEYGLGWLPLGGYCKISGMIDESMDKEAMKEEPKSWEYRSKPAWQRLFVIAGGVLFNFILAIFIYIGILAAWGESYIKNSDVTHGVYVNELAKEIGFKNGDRIISIDGVAPDNFRNLQYDMTMAQAKEVKVLRGEDTTIIDVNSDFIPKMLNTPEMFKFNIPFVVDMIPDTSINASSGLLKGDKIMAINGAATESFFAVTDALKDLSGQKIVVTVARDNEITFVNLNVSKESKIQVSPQNDITKFYNLTKKEYSFFESIPAGFNQAVSAVGGYFQQLKLIFTPETEAYKSVGSFITIGKLFTPEWDWFAFWQRTAFLSIMLAVVNILPIPALDGGHIMFTLYEIIARRKPNDKFLEYSQMVGMLILLGIMVLAMGNDIIRLFN